MSNRASGNRFEQEFAEILSKAGFWVHVMQQNKAGQPADIIAVKGSFHTLIDCKVCENGFFAFERVEDNQKFAMRMFQQKGNELCYFALKLPDETIWMVSLERIETMKGRGKKRLTDTEIMKYTWPVNKWIDAANDWGKDI